MIRLSRLATSGLLVLLATTLTTAADARGGGGGGGHSGGGPVQSSSGGGEHGRSNGWNGSNGWTGSNGSKAGGQPVHSSTAIISRHPGKTLTKASVTLSRRHPHSRKNAALVGRHPVTVPGLPNIPPPPPVVRDHRDLSGQQSNQYNGPCSNGPCQGEGGLNIGSEYQSPTMPSQSATMPSQDQSHSTGPGTPVVHDHRTGH